MNDREELLASLQAGRDEFLAAIEGVSAESAAAKPASGWSILECAEHVAIVEENLRQRLMEQATPTDNEMSREREAFLAKVAVNRGHKIQAPPVAHPTGRFATCSEAVECFRRNRQLTIDYIASCQEDLRRLTVEHPLLGASSGQEILILIIAHPFRHAKQILELRGQ
jgi:uncharacterized damage-inducible protein DinB